jgi:hypothetical protein
MGEAASARYKALGSAANFRVRFFDEGGGNHDFPPGIRQEAYAWLDSYLKGPRV